MKKISETKMARSMSNTYSAPAITRFDIEIESGFAVSNTGVVDDLEEKDYGTY